MGIDDFDCIRVIGKGSYGEVWLAKHKKDKKQYVLKKMNLGKASKRERKSSEQEAKLLSNLKHPNIVSYKDSFESDGFLYIAMQYCEGGDLYSRLKEQKGVPLEERQVVEWFVQITMALQYMHERNILHRDLKTQNIFLTKSKIIKVGDLGIARILDSASAMATTLIGTPYYMSPELFSNKPYNHKSDVWALGCCVYEMTTLKHAFNAKDMNSLVYKILKGKMPPMPYQYSTDLLNLMRSMLHQDPERRPTVNRILRDSYIKKNIAVFLEETKRSNQHAGQTEFSQIVVSRSPSASSCIKNSRSVIADTKSLDQAAISSQEKPKNQNNCATDSNHTAKPLVTLQYYFEHKRESNVACQEPQAVKEKEFIKGGSETRPLPVPIAKASIGVPHCRAENQLDNFSESSDVSSSRDDKETLKSLPNLSARQRRRQQRIEISGTNENTNSSKINLRRMPERAESDILTEPDKSNAVMEIRMRSEKEPYINKSTSSFDESNKILGKEDIKQRDTRREDKEMNNFITLLDTTLQMNATENSEEEKEVEEILAPIKKETVSFKTSLPPTPSYQHCVKDQQMHKSVSMPSVDTLTDTSRLMQRIRMLHLDCSKGVGYPILKKAYEILNKIDEDEVEPKLVDLLGKEKFDEYAGKIWQLKFCEESLFTSSVENVT